MEKSFLPDEISISIILPSLAMGGAEKVLVEIANGISRERRQVNLVVFEDTGALISSVASSVHIIDLDVSRYAASILKIALHYDAVRPSVVLTSMYATGLVALAARLISRHKPRVVIGAHNSIAAKVRYADNRKDRLFLKPMGKTIFPHADAYIAVSQGVAREFCTYFRVKSDRMHVVYNPVISASLTELAGQHVDHQWLIPPEERDFRSLISVGRLVPQKGYEDLLIAFSLVVKKIDARLLIVGDGPLRPHLEQTARTLGIRERVDFLGFQLNPHKFVARADLFIMASRWEGLGNTLIEALGCGCRVLATDCPYGPSEILEGGTYGRLSPPADPDALACAIMDELDDVNRPEISRSLRQARASQFTVSRSVEEYLKVLESVAGG